MDEPSARRLIECTTHSPAPSLPPLLHDMGITDRDDRRSKLAVMVRVAPGRAPTSRGFAEFFRLRLDENG